MKDRITQILSTTLDQLIEQESIPSAIRDQGYAIQVTRTKDPAHGDYASNIALSLAKKAGTNPRQFAELLCQHLQAQSEFSKIEIAGPGFINFHLSKQDQARVIDKILDQGNQFGRNQTGQGQRVQIEFVSANPTGPLHVGHGRGAAYGATLANVYTANGYSVHREYYVNDAGRQMDILATSVWIRYLELCGYELRFPENAYRGDYVWDIAATLHRERSTQFECDPADFTDALPADEAQGGDKEAHIDAWIAQAKHQLSAEHYALVFDTALTTILDDIKDDLALFGVEYEQWFSERSLVDSKKIEQALTLLQQSGSVYEKDGATWFRSSDYGDEKDRVLIRDNGQATYFTSDVAYHLDKYQRGFDHIINIWGADHHGYIPRVKGAMQALRLDPDRLQVLLVQFANLYRGKEKVQMSTRSGEFVTLRALRKEVGKDAARFFYVMRKSEQHLDFDMELATSKSNENPVYYVQYAHARICSVLRQLDKTDHDLLAQVADYALLDTSYEIEVIQMLSQYPEVIEKSCQRQSPHLIVQYLRDLSTRFHAYYNAAQFLVDETPLRQARLKLVSATRQVLNNGLAILDVSAPEKM